MAWGFGKKRADDDDDEEEDEEDDETTATRTVVGDVEDEEDAKAKVEKMRLGGVNDVRNVANLMKTLEPILEVRYMPLYLSRVLDCGQNLHLACT